MPLLDHAQLYVETPRPGLRVIRVAGRFDTACAARVVRLVDSQVGLVIARRLAVGQILVDLGEVTGFAPEALESFTRAQEICAAAGVGIHLTGCAGRLPLLPLPVRHALTAFPSFPTLAVALAALDPDQGCPAPG